ncbi:hypothetical protein E3P92_02992 [Wallemia ichthyophaga]|nr:hypothetical protein E3P92_02992 [Wallemia ichthyophaga]
MARVCLEVDFSGVFRGFTELTITPTTDALKTVNIHSRQANIHRVLVTPPHAHAAPAHADFTHFDPQSNIALSERHGKDGKIDVHRHPELKRKVYSALSEGDEGELSIVLPPRCISRGVGDQVSLLPDEPSAQDKEKRIDETDVEKDNNDKEQAEKDAGHAENGTEQSVHKDEQAEHKDDKEKDKENHNQEKHDENEKEKQKQSEKEKEKEKEKESKEAANNSQDFAPLTIFVEFSITHPFEGLQVVKPTETSPYRIPHIYTSPTCPDAARCWVPCIDSLWERCTWELEYITPRFLSAVGEDGVEGEQDEPVVVVSSGDLVEQVAHPSISSKTIFHFAQSLPTSVQHIAFAAGPFNVLPIPHTSSTTQSTSLHAFGPPGSAKELAASVAIVPRALHFYSSEHGMYPFSSFKVVFVHDPPVDVTVYSTVVIMSLDLLHPASAIEQTLDTRHKISHALATQWSGINIMPRSWSDMWLVQGLASYIANLFLKKSMGNNEYFFRMKKDMDRLAMNDTGQLPPLSVPNALEPPNDNDAPFLLLKAPLVLHILDRKLSKSGTAHGLSRVLPKIFLGALSGDVIISTNGFLRTCRKVAGVDLRTFADQWIFGSGTPRFMIGANFNRKKMCVEMTVKQESPAYDAHTPDTPEIHFNRPTQVFEGQMTVRIHEADGTPYEHVLDIKEPNKRFDVPFNTKYKRVRRNTKRYQARQAAAAAAAQGDEEAAEAIGMIDLGFQLNDWEQESERDRWKVEDWTEDDEAAMSQATYEWIRVDADFEWISMITFEQPDFMWVSQLQRDRDVVAQLEAVHALKSIPSKLVSTQLTRTVLVTNYFFRIRMEAAMVLHTCATPELDYVGMFHLFKIFQSRFCYPPPQEIMDPFGFKCIPLANNFDDLSEYFVRKAVIVSLTSIRDQTSRSMLNIREFLVDQLKYNDNSTNRYSDSYYLSGIINCLAIALVPTVQHEASVLQQDEDPDADDHPFGPLIRRAAVEEVERYRTMDRLVPSYQNVISVATLEFNVKLMIAGILPYNAPLFIPYTREGNYPPLRIVAFDCLMLLGSLRHRPIIQYFSTILGYDESRVVRRSLAQSMIESLIVLMATGELAAIQKKEPQFIEEDAKLSEAKEKDSSKSELDRQLKGLRKDVGKIASLRMGIMAVLLSPQVDYHVRWTLLQLCDVLYKGNAEPLPKVKFKLPAPAPHQPAEPASAMPMKIKLKAPTSQPAQPVPVSMDPVVPVRMEDETPEPEVPEMNGTANGHVTEPVGGGGLNVSLRKKKDKAVPQAQRNGMASQDVTACRALHKRLQSHKLAGWFLYPVDPVRDGAPDYFSVIKTPMDIGTMGAKLDGGHYANRFEYEADFKLIVQNATTYNGPSSPVHKTALELDAVFDKQWQRMTNTLNAATGRKPTVQVNDKMTSPPTGPEPAPALEPEPEPEPAAAISSPSKPSPPPAQPAKPRLSLKLKPPKPVDSNGDKEKQPEANGVVDTAAAPQTAQSDAPEPESTAEKIQTDATPADTQPVAAPSMQESQSQPIPEAPVTVSEAPEEPMEKAQSVPAQQSLPEENEPTSTPAPVPAPTSAPVQNGNEDALDDELLALSDNKPVQKMPPPPKASSSTPSKLPDGHLDNRKAKILIRKLMSMPEAAIFLQPVDPILHGCPTYLDEIKHPMDFSTIKRKLDEKKYENGDQFIGDIEQIFKNCRQFNGPGETSMLTAQTCDPVERALRKEWKILMTPKIPHNEKRSLLSMMKVWYKNEHAFWFLQPVDPIALGIPNYNEVIPKENMRDLSLIQTKLEKDQYPSVDAFEGDIKLMTHNAILYNGADAPVSLSAKALEKMAVKKFLREQCKVLIIGAGGLGCEIVANLALTGFSDLHIIDMDTIDVSNLNRQFLFRSSDVGKSKAVAAADFVMKRIPNVKVTAHHNKIQDFGDDFYMQFNLVVCGLDSVEARRWINATLYNMVDDDNPESLKPLIDGGTEGFKGQSRVILPTISSCYECSLDMLTPPTTFPICTIANTPRLPEHCIEWASVLEWPKVFPSKKLDNDDPDHIEWLLNKSLTRATEFNIEGVNWSLVQGVVKNIIPSVASTNAIIAASCCNEAFKIATTTAAYLNNYMMFIGNEGVFTYTFEHQKRESCVVCGGETMDLEVKDEMIVEDLLEILKQKAEFQVRKPSLSNDQGNIYLQYPPQLEEYTRQNLSKSLSDYKGQTILVTDANLPFKLSLRLV